MYVKNFFAAILLVLSGTLLSACSLTNQTPETPKETVKKAIITEGKVIKKEITIYENGTHFFETEKGEKYLLKSFILDLSPFEDKNVRITGEVEIVPDMPLLTAFAIEEIKNMEEDRTSLFSEADFSFAVELPGTWKRNVLEDALQYAPQNAEPVITIKKVKLGTTAGALLLKEIKEGTPVSVGGESAIRITGKDDQIHIVINQEAELLVFSFVPGENPTEEKGVYYEMLTGLQWITEEDLEEDEPLLQQETIYCGGVAKKLCPSGFRCELKNLEKDSSGICVDATLPPEEISAVLDTKVKEQKLQEDDNEIIEPKFGDIIEEALLEETNIPDGWTEYTRDRLSYSFAVPKSWWWKETGATDEHLSRVAIAEEEVTDTNPIVFLEILRETIHEYAEKQTEGILMIHIPRDEKTSFRLSGSDEYTEQLRGIASSLSSF